MAIKPTTGIMLLPLLLGACNELGQAIGEAHASALAQDPTPSKLEPSKLEPAPLPNGTRSVDHEQPCLDPSREQPPTTELCPPGRQVGFFPGQDCPVAPAPWVVSPLHAPLEHHCRYTWTGNKAPNLALLPAQVQAAIGPDCRVLTQSPLRGELADDFEAAFVEGTQPLVGKGTLAGGHPVEIAVVDTAPQTTSLGTAAHGPTLAALVARLASGCAPGLGGVSTCKREVQTYLGLPQTVTGPDLQKGGHFGYQSDLAEGIVAALDGWAHKDRRLVLNLAVGWEPSLGDLDGTFTERGGLAAVRDAVGLAHCQGALVVAASGNQPRGSCVDEPTGPGSWESQSAWTAAQCQNLGLANAQLHLGSHSYSPFVFAATPLTWSEANLADFRPGSNARLSAMGFSAYDTRTGSHFGPMTGSSISTATISAIAALVWSYFPTLDADELMQLLYDSGRTRQQGGVTVVASHHLHTPGSPHQHVVTACGALIHACDQAGLAAPSECNDARSRCSGYASNQRVNVQAWWQGLDDALALLPSSARQAGTTPVWKPYECQRCNLSSVAKLPRDRQIPASDMPDAWLVPQPEKGPCPICSIKSTDLQLSLDPVYDNAVNASNNVSSSPDYMHLDNVSVYIHDAIGNTEALHYGAPSPALDSVNLQIIHDSQLLTVDVLGGTTAMAPVSADVVMTFTSGTGKRITASNQIPIDT